MLVAALVSVVPILTFVVDPGSPPCPMLTFFVLPVDVAPVPRFKVELPVLLAATLNVKLVLELEPPTVNVEATFARLSEDTFVENIVAVLEVVVMSPPSTARSPAIVTLLREYTDPVRMTLFAPLMMRRPVLFLM